MKRLAYFQGTEDPKKKYKPDKPAVKRKNLDVRHPGIFTWFHNYDYSDGEPSDTSPGGGLYHGAMDKFKSVKDFIEQRRSQNKKKREKAMKESNAELRIAALKKLAQEVGVKL
jgi:hypothetical protein